jgi:hypothetical protein
MHLSCPLEVRCAGGKNDGSVGDLESANLILKRPGPKTRYAKNLTPRNAICSSGQRMSGWHAGCKGVNGFEELRSLVLR